MIVLEGQIDRLVERDTRRQSLRRGLCAGLRPALRRELTRSLGYKKLPWPPNLEARVTGTVQ